MAATPYTTQAKLQYYLKRTLTADEVAALPTLLGAAKFYIDEFTGVSFGADGSEAASDRFFDGSGRTTQNITPARDITAVKVVNTDNTDSYTYTSTDYVAKPYNTPVKAWLDARIGIFPKGVANIKVTAKWGGYADVPLNIEQAANQLIGNSLSEGSGNLKSESIEGYSRTWHEGGAETEDIDRLLLPYKIISL